MASVFGNIKYDVVLFKRAEVGNFMKFSQINT